ncbi:MAG: sugar phosphate isomerase/epimerase family protein [Blastochloris sp.]|jgi:sugar phosphate isomerase/epimerase|nr:sugar phosphate isomerase/epimerase family protein [Blastochloris sp.]
MNHTNHPHDIRIGTLAGKGMQTADYIKAILPHGFESFQINFWQTLSGLDLKKIATEVKEVLTGSGAVVSSIGIYGNPLETDPLDLETAQGFSELIKHAHLFGTDLVTGFAGRLRDKPVDQSYTRFREVFLPLAHQAADSGVRIAFENCSMGGDWNRGDWNMAFHPRAWDAMFNEVPKDNIGLEWEPCHQMLQLINPMPQIKRYGSKFFHIHGKDAKIDSNLIQEEGIVGPSTFGFHKHPGLGDSNWTRIIEELRKVGYRGSIDIEGWHDDVYRGDLEMTGQVNALHYLKACRLPFVPNPPEF